MRQGGQFSHGQLVIDEIVVAQDLAVPAGPRHALLEPVDRLGHGLGIGLPRFAEQQGQIGFVLGPNLGIPGVVGQVIVAVRQAEAAEREAQRIDIALLRVRIDGAVDRAGQAGFRKQRVKIGGRPRRRDPGEPRPRGSDSGPLYRVLIHEGGIGRDKAAFLRARRRLPGYEVFDDGAQPVFRLLAQDLERTVGRAIGRDLVRGDPLAVYIPEEIVTRPHRPVHPLRLDARFAPFLLSDGRGRGEQEGGEQERAIHSVTFIRRALTATFRPPQAVTRSSNGSEARRA